MYLEKLRVLKNKEVLREITFKNGLNIVLDETNSTPTESGNNIGKTTLLQIIDFCLGSDGKSLYVDPEFKKINQKMLNFFKSNVEFELVLYNDIEKLSIRRTITDKNTISVNGKFYRHLEFKRLIGRKLFNVSDSKPSSRNLIKKFIRIEPHQMNNTLKFLHGNAKSEEYEMVFLYLFGISNFNTLKRKEDLINQKQVIKSHIDSLNAQSPEALKQLIQIINKNIDEIQHKISNFELDSLLERESSQLADVREEITKYQSMLSNIQLRLKLQKNSLKALNGSFVDIDTDRIRSLYEDVKINIGKVHENYESLIYFHNAMIHNKIAFVHQNIARHEIELTKIKDKLSELGSVEKTTLSALSRKGALSDLISLQKEIYEQYEQKGQKEGIMKSISKLLKDREKVNAEISDVSNEIEKYIEKLEKHITKFNSIFSRYSKLLYNEQFILTAKFEKQKNKPKVFKFEIVNVKDNLGAGKKKAQVAAFDLAYLSFLEQMNARTMRFTLNDRVEYIHGNQFNTLIKIANQIQGQYIVAVLKDKIGNVDSSLIEECTILKLSQNDKFFKIE